ncbi:hypothetical protein [Paramylibacter ulvae]|nr:hypothetical protein [Amylibacter ulvae]
MRGEKNRASVLSMIDLDWMTALIIRTIGAQRGRAARGSPA